MRGSGHATWQDLMVLSGPRRVVDLPQEQDGGRCGLCGKPRVRWPDQAWLYRDGPGEVCLGEDDPAGHVEGAVTAGGRYA